MKKLLTILSFLPLAAFGQYIGGGAGNNVTFSAGLRVQNADLQLSYSFPYNSAIKPTVRAVTTAYYFPLNNSFSIAPRVGVGQLRWSEFDKDYKETKRINDVILYGAELSYSAHMGEAYIGFGNHIKNIGIRYHLNK